MLRVEAERGMSRARGISAASRDDERKDEKSARRGTARKPRRGRDKAMGLLVRVLVLGLELHGSSVSWAQGVSAHVESPAETRARKLIDEAAGAVAAQQLPRARQLLERAYRIMPLPEILLQLGKIAQAEGLGVAAADLFRRYLDSVQDLADAATKTAIAQHLASLKEPISEVQVTAPDGSLFLVDGRLVGHTPLSGPLLLSPGPRRFAIETGGKRYESDSLSVPAGRPAHVNLTPGAKGTAITVLSLTPAALLGLTVATVSKGAERDKTWASSLRRAIAGAVEKEQTVLISEERLAPLLRAQPADCLTQPQCQEQLAAKAEARTVLRVAVSGAPKGGVSSYRFAVSVFDLATGQIAASTEVRCDTCGQSAALGQLSDAVRRMVAQANSRPRGFIAIDSTPAKADVLVDGNPVGKTPLERMSFAGSHSITIKRSGYTPHEAQIDVVLGQTTRVQAGLVRLARGAGGKRPLWRLVVGGVALGGGVLAAGFGISGLAFYGQCGDSTPPPEGLQCQTVYLTRVVGGSLLGGGLALSLAGAVLLAVPPSGSAPSAPLGPAEGPPPALSLVF